MAFLSYSVGHKSLSSPIKKVELQSDEYIIERNFLLFTESRNVFSESGPGALAIDVHRPLPNTIVVLNTNRSMFLQNADLLPIIVVVAAPLHFEPQMDSRSRFRVPPGFTLTECFLIGPAYCNGEESSGLDWELPYSGCVSFMLSS